MTHAKPLYTTFDIETSHKPEDEIRALLPKFDPDKVKVPKTITKADTREAYIDKERATYGDDIVAKAALHPDYALIKIAGFKGSDGIVQFHGDDEKSNILFALERINEIIAMQEWVTGYNIVNFDIPMLIWRAWRLKLPVQSRIFNRTKPRYPFPDSIVDLREVAKAGCREHETGGLDGLLRSLGLPPKTGSGADFPALWLKDPAAALDYNRDDLDREHAVAEILLT